MARRGALRTQTRPGREPFQDPFINNLRYPRGFITGNKLPKTGWFSCSRHGTGAASLSPIYPPSHGNLPRPIYISPCEHKHSHRGPCHGFHRSLPWESERASVVIYLLPPLAFVVQPCRRCRCRTPCVPRR
ncbi:hypothetical protein BS78_02G328300 [Paspalum vaginatum]|nr:hypothetical protein BS78_02G328300 [Paspalum vaginatum]